MKIELDDSKIEFVINGQTLTVDAFEAFDLLAAIDTRHRNAADTAWDTDPVPEYIALLYELMPTAFASKYHAVQFHEHVIDVRNTLNERLKKKRESIVGSLRLTPVFPAILQNGQTVSKTPG